ncbi:hypothetical protein M899_2762 [Bacteriovorax sp. BSW11_IV]|uniref:hypothetical protein n=1 Tax=Bacteriovorax sp. BSW11_IV TaxID=1353529 RepID=UPI000389DA6E|nr:hypothetical protein [Bacteriovorax sp. BSW11_IV]EQC49051.1 hypothetical protein M899_2762 [Bacteriovorax sp. BSW11_IV]
MQKRLDYVLNHALLVHFLLFGMYLVGMWLVHLALVSLVTFFHLQLDHNFSVIDNWLNDQSWGIAFVTKLVTLVISLNFINIWSTSRKPFVDLIKGHHSGPVKSVWAYCLFILLFMLVYGRPIFNPLGHISVLNVITSIIGTSLFFASDVFVVLTLEDLYPVQKRERAQQVILYSVMSFLFAKNVFAYTDGFDFSYLILSLILFFLLFYKDAGWRTVIPFLLFVAIPHFSLFGKDPFWKGEYSPFIYKWPIESLHYLIILIVLFCYTYYKKKNVNSK